MCVMLRPSLWPSALPWLALCLLAHLTLARGSYPAGAERTWYLAAQPVEWDYLPGGMNNCQRPGVSQGQNDTGDWREWTTDGIGTVLKKAGYVQYADSTFQEAVPKPKEFEHTGLLGPILRTHVGETVQVVFHNFLPFPVNLEPSGLQLPAGSSAAAAFAPAAAPNETVTYVWTVAEAAGPSPGEPAYKFWLYRSTVDATAHDNAGLVGGFLVGRSPTAAAAAAAQEDASQAPEADQDIITVFQILDESLSPFLGDNLGGRTPEDLGLGSQQDLKESLMKHTVNGYLFCSGPAIEMVQGDRVRWHVATVGTEVDLHNAHWHGNTFLQRGLRDDQVKLIPGSVESVVMNADNSGIWLLHCHVNDHLMAGMMALYTVQAVNDGMPEELKLWAQLNATTRHYFVAAEEVVWDYAPLGGEMCSGLLEPLSEAAQVFVKNGTNRIGSRYIKAQYFEYTDANFTQRKPRAPEDEYLGIMGPILRAEVGDTISVIFLNRLRFPASMHPHGVRYFKSSEGSPYNDGTTGPDTVDDAVPPGGSYNYLWLVPETASPGPAGGSTRLWMYHSHTNEISDTYAGLFGGIIVGTRGAFNEGNLTAKDVDREIMLHFGVMDEGLSLYYGVNLQGFLGGYNPGVAMGGHNESDPSGGQAKEVEAFQESNLMHAINGYVYCNMPPLRFALGERIRIYLMALGTEVDMHTPNMQRSVLHSAGGAHTMAAVGLLPGSMHTVDVVAQVPGQALLQCRVADHITAGMAALYTVQGGGEETAPGSGGVQQFKALQVPLATPRYFIAAEPAEWDYAPLGLNACTGEAFDEVAAVYVERVAGSTIGSRYGKALYRQYTDETFTQQVEQPPENGILGPVIHLEAGQSFEVVLQNRLDFPANLAFDGTLVPLHQAAGSASVAAVPPGGNFTYSYAIPDSMAPGASDLSTVAYAYTSSVDPVAHPNAGLVGLLLVAAPGSLSAAAGSGSSDGPGLLPEGVDRLVTLVFNIQNENKSPLLAANIAAAGVDGGKIDPGDFEESNLKHSINGYVYCNLPELEIPANGTTRFVLLGMGSEADIHSPVFTGQVLRSAVTTSRAAELMPTVTRVVDVVAPMPGVWQLYCDVHDHLIAGMRATVVVA